MLEKLDLDRKLPKKEYKQRLPLLQRRLLLVQRACWQAGLGSLVVFEGWEGAGKGPTINKLTERLEPRGFKLHLIRAPRSHQAGLPWMWRFWMALPRYGEMAIFDRSWYAHALEDYVERGASRADWLTACREITHFEQTLADDRYVVVKLFFHLGKEERERRLEKLEADPTTAWRVSDQTWEHHRRYEDYRVAVEEALALTESEWGPWEIIAATDRRWTRVRAAETLLQRLETALASRGFEVPGEEELADELADEAADDGPGLGKI